MFSAPTFRTNENSNLNAGNSFNLVNQNPSNLNLSNNENTTPQKLTPATSSNQSNSNIFAASNTNKTPLFSNNPSSNNNLTFGNNSISNGNSNGGIFGNNSNSGLFGGSSSSNNNNVNNNSSIFGIGNSTGGNQDKGFFGGNVNTSTLGNSANPSSNLFGGSNNSNTSNVFMAPNKNNNTNNGSIFGQIQEPSNANGGKPPGPFGNENNPNNSQFTFGANTNQNLANNKANINLNQNIFGNNPANNNNNPNATGNTFGNNNIANSNNQASNSIFGSASNVNNNNSDPNANKNSVFGNAKATSSGNNPGLFSNSSGSLFGNKTNENAVGASTNPQTQSNLFGNNSTSSNSNSLFGNNSSSNTNQNPANNQSSTGIFGNNTSTQTITTSNTSLFGTNTGNNPTQTSSNNSLFGNKQQTSSSNLMGNNANNTLNPNPEANKSTTNILGNAPAQTSNFGTNPFGNQNPTNSNNPDANKNPTSSGGLFNSSANPPVNKPSETKSLFGNNSSNPTTTNINQVENKSLFGNSMNPSNPSNSSNQANPSASLFSTSATTQVKPPTGSLFNNPTTNPLGDANKPNNSNPVGSSLFSAASAPNKTEPQNQESAQTENKSLFGNPTANSTNPIPANSNNTSTSLFKTNLTTGKITSPIKNNQTISSNPANIPINNPEKAAAESKSKLNHFTIYPYPNHKPLEEKPSIKPIPYENNLESRKNILGISRNEISERVIEAITKRMTIKEFFAKASEEALHESKLSSLKPKSFKTETQYEIGDGKYSRSKDSYLETKYQMYLQREIFKQKQKNESKRRINDEKNAYDYAENIGNFAFGSMGKSYEKDFYKTFRKQSYMTLLEKNFEMNKNDSPFNNNLADVNFENFDNLNKRESEDKRDFNLKNYELIKVMNEKNFGNANNSVEMQSKLNAINLSGGALDNKKFYSGKTYSNIPLADRANEEIDLYDPSFWQSKLQQTKESKEEEKKGLTKHLSNIKSGINKFLSIFSQEESEERASNVKDESSSLNKKIISIVAEIKDKNIFLSFHAHKNSPVSVLKGYIIEKLIERNEHKFSSFKNEHVLVLFKSSILVDENPLGNYEFDPSADNIIQVIISSPNDPLRNSAQINTSMNQAQPNNGGNSANENKTQEGRKNLNLHGTEVKSHLHVRGAKLRKKSKSPGKENLNSNTYNQMIIDSEEPKNKEASDNYFPVFNNEFELYPSIQYIYRMKKTELKNVEGFKICNSYGKIKFKSKVDLTYLNLSEIVKIDRFEIELYPGKQMPKPGEGLNKPAVITIKQLFDQKENEKELVKSVKEKGGRFIKYDEYKGKFKFEVDKWIK